MNAYYNEYDPKAAAWLRGLIKAGRIAPGFVDERSITEVDPEYVKLFTQAHFFAGIGGWSYALRLAGWADNRPVWTGSPPCQPFSNAGKQKAQADARHLWPVFFNLIRECKPTNIFGEQVEAAIRTGWLDDLQDDLEAEGYATGKIVLPACSVGGFHIRQRIWFVAERMGDADNERSQRHGEFREQHDAAGRQEPAGLRAKASSDGGLADTASDRCAGQGQGWPTEEGREPQPGTDRQLSAGFERPGDNGGLAESDSARREQRQWNNQTARHGDTVAAESRDDRPRSTDAPETFWANPDWLFCRDGKWRPVESEVQRVVDGLSDELVRSCNIRSASYPLAKDQEARVMRLKGYGNAIAAPLAAEFIKAYLSIDFGNA